MPSTPSAWCLTGILCAGLCFTGCAHHTYSPYGYGYGYGPGYPPTYTPPQNFGPGVAPVYTPQPSTQSFGSPTPLTTPPSTTNNPLNLRQPSKTPTNDAPMFQPNPNSGKVPDPSDPLDEFNKANPGASLPTGSSNTAKLPVYERGGLAAAAPPVVADVVQTVGGSESDPFFEAPARLPMPAEATPMDPSAPNLSSYGYDRKSFTWLKGAVDFDAKTETWSIIYNLKPDALDQYGGSFAITPHPDLGKLQIGDIALLEGAIDTKTLDASGRPIYNVTKVTPIVTQP